MRAISRGFEGKAIAAVCLVGLVTCWTGCGGKGSVAGRPATIPVQAVVHYKGQPAVEANVQFLPNSGDGSAAVAATGITDAQGVARMMTFEQGDGVVPGSYRVTIRKSVPVGGTAEASPDAPPVPVQYRDELPGKYAVPETSGLTAEVDKSRTEFSFELTD